MVAHAVADEPNECCGLLAGTNGVITEIHRATNVAEDKRVRYDVHDSQLVRMFAEFHRSKVEHLGIYHSHPRSEAWPSKTDRRLAYYNDVVYFIVSLAQAHPRVKAFRLLKTRLEDDDAAVSEESIEIVEGGL
jgi:proteasome lid subunit RPN8/RPN11